MKKSPRSTSSTRERLLQRKEEFAKKSSYGTFQFIKEGTTRLRMKSQGDDKELGMEVTTFYLGKELGTVYSPMTFGEDCPFMEMYQKLKASSKESDKNMASLIVPKKRYLIGGIGYKDIKGKEIDQDKIDKVWVVTQSVYQDIIDLYLDEDEWGDMTDNDEGYDLKITRTGTGKNDTNYTVSPCQKKALPSKLQGPVDIEGIMRTQVKSYDELSEILEKYLNSSMDDGDEKETPRKKLGDVKKKKKLHKKSDI